MRGNSTARDGSADSQLDSGSPCIAYSKAGLHLRITWIFTCYFYFKGIAAKTYVADNGIVMRKIFSSPFNPYITNSFSLV